MKQKYRCNFHKDEIKENETKKSSSQDKQNGV
jgi:hypothetical protein